MIVIYKALEKHWWKRWGITKIKKTMEPYEVTAQIEKQGCGFILKQWVLSIEYYKNFYKEIEK